MFVLSHSFLCTYICNMYKQYRKYFQHQCTVHPQLLHEDVLGKQVFEMVTVEEAYGDFRLALPEKGFAFRLLEMSFAGGDTKTGDLAKFCEGGFIICRHWSEKMHGKTERFAAQEECEVIVDEFLEKMIADSKTGHPLFPWSVAAGSQFNLNAQELVRTGDGSYAGWLVTFRWMNKMRNCLGKHPDATWKTLTPHNL